MADAPNPDAWRATVRRRLVVVAVIFDLWTTAVQARLLWLQVYEHERLLKSGRQPDLADADPAGHARADHRSRGARPGDVGRRRHGVRGPERDRRRRGHGAQVVRGPRGLPHVERTAGRAGGQAVEGQAVHLRQAACLARGGRRGRRAQAGWRGPAQGEPPVLPDARADGRRSRLCRPRQQGPGRDRAEVQRHHPGQGRAGAGATPTPSATPSTASACRRPPARPSS